MVNNKKFFSRCTAAVMAVAILLGGLKIYPEERNELKAASSEESIIGVVGKGYSLCLKKNGKDTGICIVSEDGSIAFENKKPVELRVADTTLEKEEKIQSGYTSVSYGGNAWVGKAEVKSGGGSIFEVVDSYIPDADGIRMERSVFVLQAAGGDGGFASYISLGASMDTAASYEDYEYFIPAMLYKDTENVAGYAAFSKDTFHGEEAMAKETRTGLPMVMVRRKATGQTLAIAHIADDISDKASNETLRQRKRCDSLCRYGAVGVVKQQGIAAAFRYPYLEAPDSYATGNGKNVCYHPVQKGESQHYSLNLFATSTEDYNQAMIACYKHHYENLNPRIADIDVQTTYQAVIQDVSSYVQERGSGIGLPFAVYVDDGSIFIDGSGSEAINFQMGFIGMQIPLAYQMMRYGKQYKDEETLQKGIDIMNFWASRCQTESGVVKVWFDTNDFRPYPAFLRIMTDGMEGMLDACQIMGKPGDSAADAEKWRQTVLKYADFLLEKQNEDGSFYRAYDYDGNAFTEDNDDGLIGDNNTQGESKLNSAVPVRFLVRMYEWTGDRRYLDSAKRAGGYVLENLYKSGKYAGGTADNPNTVDKEAGMYAVYAYSALYAATGEEQYLRAMEQAVVYSMSWVYTYKFSAVNADGILTGIPTTLGMNDGLSFIATGHSAVDNMIAYLYYEMFKLYVWTGDEVYYDMSHFIQNNTKQTMDLDGKYGYSRKSFMIEATGIADLVFGTAGGRGIWLPWISCANAEPISEMEDTFGAADVSAAKSLGESELRKRLTEYGAGGCRH